MQRRNEQVGHGPKMVVAEGDQGSGHFVERDRPGYAEIDPSERGCGRERDDEGVDAGARGQEAVDQAAERADPERDGNRQEKGEAVELHRRAEDDGGQPAERADGDVHLADAQRHHLREGDEQADAEASQHDIKVEFGEEVRRDDAERQCAQEDGDRETGPLDEKKAAEQVHRIGIPRRS